MARLSKLFAILSIAVAWAFKCGLWRHQQKPIPFKKHGYKAKSFFRYGFDYLSQTLSNLELFPEQFEQALNIWRPCPISTPATIT